MAKLNPIGSGKPSVSIIDAAIISLGDQLKTLKEELHTQRSEARNIVIGVLVAFVAIVVTVAVELMLSNEKNSDVDKKLELNEKITSQEIQINNLENKVNNIKIRNPYLK